ALRVAALPLIAERRCRRPCPRARRAGQKLPLGRAARDRRRPRVNGRGGGRGDGVGGLAGGGGLSGGVVAGDLDVDGGADVGGDQRVGAAGRGRDVGAVGALRVAALPLIAERGCRRPCPRPRRRG